MNKLMIILLPLLASCGTAERMNQLVNESTYSIQANSRAIANATAAIEENKRGVEASTQAMKANGELLK